MVLKKLLVLKVFFLGYFILYGICFSETHHFVFLDSQILIPEEDEVGVFTPDGLCVGASILDAPLPLPIVAWKDDPLTTEIDGYTLGDTMYFEFWNSSEEIEKDAEPLYTVGDGTFGYGSHSRLSLSISASAVEDSSEEVLYSFILSQNYPNPFNLETKIDFAIPLASRVQMKIYNVAGQLVKMYQADYAAGVHSLIWDGTNTQGKNVGSGIYFYRMEAGNFVQQKRMVLLK
jgi:hypothetical protein